MEDGGGALVTGTVGGGTYGSGIVATGLDEISTSAGSSDEVPGSDVRILAL